MVTLRRIDTTARRLAALLLLAQLATCATPANPDAGDPDASDIGTNDSTRSDVVPDRPFNDPYLCSPAGMAPRLDEALDGTQVRAGVVTRDAELITGEGAYGRVGDYKLYNDRVQFIVQGPANSRGPRRPVGLNLYGGNLIDADRVRRPGERGHDVFREIFPLVGLRVQSADEMTVVCDGSGGRPAVVRVIGTDQPTRLLPFDNLARRRYVRIITHYILRPGSDVLEMRTTIDPVYGQQIDSVQLGEFLAFGAGLTLFTPGTGFGDPAGNRTPPTYIAAVTDPGEGDRHVSYAVSLDRGGINIPSVDVSGTAAIIPDISIPAGGYGVFTRLISVGTGDVASAAGPMFRARNDPFGTITGQTNPGALVYAYPRPYRPGAPAASVARATMSGAFTIPIAPGDYDLLAVDQGRARGATVGVTVAAGAMVTANPMAGPTGTLVLDVAELGAGGGRLRMPMKVTLIGVDVEAPDSNLGSLEGERESYGIHRVVFTTSGTDRIRVKPGRYRAILSRGPEYDIRESMVTVPADGEATFVADVRRVVDTTNYIAGDYHQHTIGSVDSPRTLCNRVLENVAEGLEHAATTDHDNATDFGPCIRQLDVGRWFSAIVGNEISVNGIGHFNAYPLAIDPADPYRLVGAQYWADLTPAQLFERIRAERTDPVLHLSHPRSTFKGYFAWLRLDPVTLGTNASTPIAPGWHAIEVNESLGDPAAFLASNDRALSQMAMTDASRPPVLHDFFAFINRGRAVAALGNSDTHSRNNGSGYPRNLLRIGTDDPSAVTPSMVREAIRAARLVVSNGIFIRVRVGGVERMGLPEMVRSVGGMVELDVEIQAPPWVTTTDFVVYENGRPMVLTSVGMGTWDAALATTATGLTTPLTGSAVVRFRGTIRVRPTRDSTYVVVARGGPLRPIDGGNAFGYTNAVYVDTGDGMWMPPIQ